MNEAALPNLTSVLIPHLGGGLSAFQGWESFEGVGSSRVEYLDLSGNLFEWN